MFAIEEIKNIIQQGENNAVEFKAATVHPDSLANEMDAFSGEACRWFIEKLPKVAAGLNLRKLAKSFGSRCGCYDEAELGQLVDRKAIEAKALTLIENYREEIA